MSHLKIKTILSGLCLLSLASCVPIEPGTYSSSPYNSSSYSQRLDHIPSSYQSIYHNGQRYHYRNGIYYKQRGSAYYRVPNPRAHSSHHHNLGNRFSPTAGHDRRIINGKTYYERRGSWYKLRGSRMIRVSKPVHYNNSYHNRHRGGYTTRTGYTRHNIRGNAYYEKNGSWYLMNGSQLVRTRRPR